MEIRQLESFLAVSETLHFGRAAERLHLSQPALSRQIQQLEGELRVPLLQRSGSARGVALTPAGQTLVPHARRVLAELEAARIAISRQAGRLEGHLAVACFDSASAYLIPAVLARLDARAPGLSLSVATLGTRDALRSVREGDLDAAIVTLPVPPEGLHVLPLYREQLVAVLPRQHPLTLGHGRKGHRDIPIRTLATERLVTFLAGHNNTRRLIDEAFAREGGAPAAVIELASVAAIKDAVRAGLGVALLGEMAVAGRTRERGLVALSLAERLDRGVGLVSRSDRLDEPLLVLLVGVLVEVAQALGLPTATAPGDCAG